LSLYYNISLSQCCNRSRRRLTQGSFL